MKTVKIMLPLLAALMFGNGVVRAQNEAKHDKPAVEVVVFHGVKQCQTCQAIKKNSQEVAEELAADGKNVSYRVVDFSKPEGKDEAKKYEIAWTSLLLIRHDAGDKETVRNISKFAIENARTNTEKFRKQLAEDIFKHISRMINTDTQPPAISAAARLCMAVIQCRIAERMTAIPFLAASALSPAACLAR